MLYSGSLYLLESYRKKKLKFVVLTFFAALLTVSVQAQLSLLSKTRPVAAYKLPVRYHLTNNIIHSDLRTAPIERTNVSAKDELTLNIASTTTTGSFRIYISGNKEQEIFLQILDKYRRPIDSRTVPSKAEIKFGYWYHPGTYYVRVVQGDVKKEVKLIKQAE